MLIAHRIALDPNNALYNTPHPRPTFPAILPPATSTRVPKVLGLIQCVACNEGLAYNVACNL
jgi:hypothetical protein